MTATRATATRTTVVIVAAGDGVRLGLGWPKALALLGGRTVLDWSLDGVLAADVTTVVIAAPPAHLDAVQSIADAHAGDVPIVVVVGAATRQASVAAALAAAPESTDVVLIHDAARPLTPSSVVDTVRAAVVDRSSGVIPALTPADTVKQLDDSGAVQATLDRTRLAAVQTPQGFPFRALREAYSRATVDFTDDAALFAADGGAVSVVPGDAAAFKITTRWDLARAEDLVGRAATGSLRTGLGVDVHAFDPDAPLALGGLQWPGQPGLAGHSDGDAVCHAIVDALLSAAGQGDIGGVFGVDQPSDAGRAGVDFIRAAVARLRRAGAVPVNVSVQLLGNAPRIAPRRAEMEAALTAAVGAPVSVGGTTTDGLGFTGRGDGVTAVATALVRVG